MKLGPHQAKHPTHNPHLLETVNDVSSSWNASTVLNKPQHLSWVPILSKHWLSSPVGLYPFHDNLQELINIKYHLIHKGIESTDLQIQERKSIYRWGTKFRSDSFMWLDNKPTLKFQVKSLREDTKRINMDVLNYFSKECVIHHLYGYNPWIL